MKITHKNFQNKKYKEFIDATLFAKRATRVAYLGTLATRPIKNDINNIVVGNNAFARTKIEKIFHNAKPFAYSSFVFGMVVATCQLAESLLDQSKSLFEKITNASYFTGKYGTSMTRYILVFCRVVTKAIAALLIVNATLGFLRDITRLSYVGKKYFHFNKNQKSTFISKSDLHELTKIKAQAQSIATSLLFSAVTLGLVITTCAITIATPTTAAFYLALMLTQLSVNHYMTKKRQKTLKASRDTVKNKNDADTIQSHTEQNYLSGLPLENKFETTDLIDDFDFLDCDCDDDVDFDADCGVDGDADYDADCDSLLMRA